VRRATLAAVIAAVSGSLLLCQGAAAQGRDLPDGIDNPRPRYYDYHPPGVFYGDTGPVGFAASGYVVAPYAQAPAYGAGGYAYSAPPYPASGYVAAPYAQAPAYGAGGYAYSAPPYPAAGVIVPIAPRPLCGVYRYWRDGVCIDRRGY
jgi:hypothetical protein